MHTVAVLVSPETSGLTAAMAGEVFGYPPDDVTDWYRLVMCAESARSTPLIGGITFDTAHGLTELAAADTVIVSGTARAPRPPSPELVGALRKAHDRGARLVSLCTGAFALAGAGLLDGRRATTHWSFTSELAARHPEVNVDPAVLYVDDGDVLTSAGNAAGLDLCLHLVRTDHGARVANRVARWLVAQPHRDGGQAQFIDSPVNAEAEDDRIAASMAWATARIDQPLTVAALARQARMSPRSYQRHFAAGTGTTPLRWLVTQRINASLPPLEQSEMSIEEISRAVGFDSAVTFRHHFTRLMRTSPTAYRRAFRRAGGEVSSTAVLTATDPGGN